MLSLSPSPWAASEIIRWMLGALTDRSLDDLTIAAPLIALGGALVLMCREPLNALTLGEDGARSLGIDLDRVRWMMCIGMGLLVGASVARRPESSASSVSWYRTCCGHSSARGPRRCSCRAPSAARRSCWREMSSFDCCRAVPSCNSEW